MNKHSIRWSVTTLTLAIALTLNAEEKLEKVKLADLPPAVQQTIQKSAESGTIKSIKKETDGDKVEFEAVIVSDGKTLEVVVAPDGKLLQTEERLQLAATPEKVQATIKQAVGDGEIHEVNLVTESSGESYYEVEFKKDGKKHETKIAKDGQLKPDTK